MKRFLTFLLFTLAILSAKAQTYVLDQELTWDQVKGGITAFALVSGSEVLYGSGSQNTAMAVASTALNSSNNAVTWKVESTTGGYLFQCYNAAGTTKYTYWKGGYLNAQESQSGVSFILGNTDKSNGQDIDNGAVWTVTSTTGGYYIKNVGNSAYLNGTSTSASADKVWKFYSIKEGSSSSSSGFNMKTQDDDSAAKCTITDGNGYVQYTTTSSGQNILFKNKSVDVTGYNQFKITFEGSTDGVLYFSVGGNPIEIGDKSTAYTYDIPSGTNTLSEITLVAVGSGRTIKIKSAELVNAASITHTITVDGTSRSYDLYIPDNVGATPALVFSLHGANGHSSDKSPFGKNEADAKGCIVVYPQGLGQYFAVFGGNVPGWNATGENNEEIKFFKAIIEDVKNYHAINEKRIYCCGFSNGGMMTYAAANAASDVFAAFAAISGFPMNEFHHRHAGASPRPFLHIQGKEDSFVKYEYMPYIRDNMVARLGANPIATTTTVTGKYTKNVYAAGTNGFPYVYYEIEGMGHSGYTSYTEDNNSTLTMWNFFNQYTLDSECDATLKWNPNLDKDGFTPSEHGWTVTNSTTFKYGDATPTAKPNVSHSLQFEKGDYQLRFQTTGTAGNKITINLKKVDGTEVFTKEATVGQKQYISYNIPAYGEYTITITKASASDKFSSLGAYMTTTAWAGATEVGQEGSSSTPESVSGTDLTKEMFHNWTAADATGTIVNETVYPVYTLNESTDMVYGYSTVAYKGYADLSEYGKLVITTTEGAPRCLFDRVTDGGTVQAETPRDSKYQTVDGTTYTIDLQAIVADYGFAHLHAIKGANNANVTVTSMKLYPVDNCLKVTTIGAQTNAWDWQIRYPLPTALESGKTYTIEMVAKAGAAVTIQPIAVYSTSSNKDQWGGSADLQYLSASITTDWSTVSFETNGNYPYDYLYFNIGKVNGDLMISNLKITEKSSGTVILNNNMNDNSTWTKTQSELTLATVSVDESATSGSGSSTNIASNSSYPMGAIRQKGNQLVMVDDESKSVVLHGVMDTPSAYFQAGRWTDGVKWADYNNTETNIPKCLAYFKKVFEAINTPSKGTYSNLFRLHLDPCWLQGSTLASGFTKASDGTITDPHGSTVSGEANIGYFDKSKFEARLQDLYIPIIKDAIAHGQYVIVRPPGVFPHEIVVGDYYNEYLKTIWDIISKDSYIKANAGYISLELGNEPVHIWGASADRTQEYWQYGNNHTDLYDFFQPIVNIIRNNGFDGIIWAPGTAYQAEYRGYSYKMLEDPKSNLGFAAHFYPGWYNTTSNDATCANTDANVLSTFKTQIPVQANYPIVITEVDWSPKDGAGGHYDEHGDWVVSNYGTWGTGSTTQNSRFGEQFKYVTDQCGNISYTIEGADLYVDMDKYLEDQTIQPSFLSKAHANNVDIYEACSGAAFKWYKEYVGGEYEWTDTYVPGSSSSASESNLTTDIFHKWTGTTATTTIEEQNPTCTYALNESTGQVYGDAANVNCYYYADLSSYSKLAVTATEGEPRFLFNRQSNEGDVELEFPRDKASKAYETIVENTDGSKTYTIDLEAIVAEAGYAHLNAIKGANWQDVTVTSMKLIKRDCEEFDFAQFATEGSATWNADSRTFNTTGGKGGWTFVTPKNLSAYKYLVMTSAQDRNSCTSSVKVFLNFEGSDELHGETTGCGTFTKSGNGLWFDQYNHRNIIVLDLDKLSEGGYDITKLSSLKFGTWNGGYTFYPNNVYLTNQLPDYANGDLSRTSTEGGRFGTICLPYAAACSGAYVYEITGKKDGQLYMKRVPGLLEAGKAYFYCTTENYEGNTTYQVYFYKASAVEVATPIINNGMVGNLGDAYYTPYGNGLKSYILKNNQLYFVDSDVKTGKNKAYINMEKVPDLTSAAAAKSITMAFFGGDDDVPTDVEAVSAIGAGATPVAIYDLSGNQLRTLHPGINIIRMSDNTTRKVIVK